MPNRVIEKINLSLHQSSILRNSCPPDIIGADYYVIFERHLDENVSRYPEGYRIQGFADVPVVHVDHDQPSGIKISGRDAGDVKEQSAALSSFIAP